MAVRIQFRRGTAAEWAAANPILSAGELGYETDTATFKIGNGSTVWNSLGYASLSEDYVDQAIANVIGLAPETLDTLNELAAALGDDPNFANTITNSIANAQSNAESYADSAVASHNLETENVHGIANTLALETQSGAQSKADSAQSNAQSYTDNAIADLIDTAPGTLDTLNELAAALGDDPNFATTIANTMATKLSFLVDTGENFRAGNTVSVANTVYIDTTAPGFVRIGDGVNIYDDLPDIGSDYALGIMDIHKLETENVHGISNTANLLYQSDLTTHAQVTTNVHGISNTANLVYQSEFSGLQTQVDNLEIEVDAKLDSATASSTYAPLSNPTFIESATLPANTSIGTVSSTEIGHLDGVTSGIQSQLDAKAPTANATFTGTVSLPNTTSIGDVSDTEIGYLNGVTSAVQTQIDGKEPTITGAATTITGSNLTASRALASDASGKVEVSSVTSTELGYVSGVTSAIQTQLDSKLNLSGGTMTGFITLHADPTQAMHATTKEYVDNVSSGILAKPSVVAATTANLTATYSNGTNGVGATLTSTSNGAFPQIDGVSVTTVSGQRGVLVKNQTDPAENGRYNLTTQGDENTAWVLTRCGLCDEAGEIPGAYIFVTDGTVNGQTGWVLHVDDPATFTVGTDDIDAFQFAGTGTITAGNNISVVGNQVSVIDSPSFTGTVTLPNTTSIGDVSATEIGYLNGVTSGIQSQLDAKAPISEPTFTGAVTVSGSGIVFTDGTQTKQGVPSITAISQKTGSYTLSNLNERDTIIEISNAASSTLTIPLNSSVAYPVGTTIDVIQTGAGQVTIAGAGGVTVNATPGLKLRTQWSSATLLKRGTDTWLVYGDLTA